MIYNKLALLIFGAFFSVVKCQSGHALNPGLMQCYNNTAIPGVTIANERPPANINILVELIRRYEDANPTLSPRELSLLIIQNFRQDGIARTTRTVDERFVIPYAASRFERHKFRKYLRSALPTSTVQSSFGDLSGMEQCTLHYMISNTIDEVARGTESTECATSAKYTQRILSRSRRDGEDVIGEGDAEVPPEGEDTEFVAEGLLGRSSSVSSNTSQCPLELGVIQTQSGTVKAGNFLAGIAAGLNQQIVTGVGTATYDNRYATTLAGELCETALMQATTPLSLGASGGWNSTINPRYYILQSSNLLQATDAELRGALDGLYMGLKMTDLTATYSDLRISQMIDMYYSPFEKGIFNSSFKACNRNTLYSDLITSSELQTQVETFMAVLNAAAVGEVSVTSDAFPFFSEAAITALESYLSSLATSDLACRGTLAIERVVSDVLIFIDSSWNYTTVQPVLSQILNNIDVNKFQSRFTLFGGSSTRNLTTNGTRYLSDFYLNYNQTVHSNETTGFNYISIFELVENYGTQKLDNSSYAGGESTIVLLIPRTAITEEQNTFLSQRREYFEQRLPDIRFLVLGSGNGSDYSTIVSNTNRDVVILEESTNEETLRTIADSIITNIKEVPRSIVNPACTSQFTGSASTFFLTEYVEPLGTNYYKVSPQYFYNGEGNRNLTITEQGYGTITVCYSRDNSRPSTSTNGTCVNLASNQDSTDISSYCEGSTISDCQPIYISVTGSNSSVKCQSTDCRFPDDIQYTITFENVGCTPGGTIVHTASVFLVLLLCALSWFS